MKLRKKRKQNNDAEELDITALLDILVILLVFLLKSFNDSDLTVDLVNELSLPYSMSRTAGHHGVILQVNKKGNVFISLSDARKNKLKLKFNPKKPKFIGRRVFKNVDLKLLSEFIDWSPFFQTWDLHGKYPNILKDKVVGESASQLFNEAQNSKTVW